VPAIRGLVQNATLVIGETCFLLSGSFLVEQSALEDSAAATVLLLWMELHWASGAQNATVPTGNLDRGSQRKVLIR